MQCLAFNIAGSETMVTAKKTLAKKTAAKKTTAKKAPARKAAIKRTLLEPTPGDKRYVRRDPEGKFKHEVDAGKSISANMRSTTTTKAKTWPR